VQNPSFFNTISRRGDDKEFQGRMEVDALEDLMTFEHKKLEKIGRYILKLKNLDSNIQSLEVESIVPDAGEPQILTFLEEQYDEPDKAMLEEAQDVCLKIFDKMEATALNAVRNMKKIPS